MVRLTPLLFGLACLSVSPALAQTTPRSVSECERLKNDLAYNQCLALFGPAAKNVAGSVENSAAAASASVATALAAIPKSVAAALPAAEEALRPSGRRGRRGRYTRHGRQSASFAVGGHGRSYRRSRRH